jgi:ribosome maturation factor RimP
VKSQTDIQAEIAEIVSASDTGCEVLLVELVGGRILRVFIDHPDGVSLSHCQSVTDLLGDFREKWALEVSSPGPERPLTRPEHFIKYSGRKARLKLAEPILGDERRTLSGEIVDADADRLVLLADGEQYEVRYAVIGRANLIAA